MLSKWIYPQAHNLQTTDMQIKYTSTNYYQYYLAEFLCPTDLYGDSVLRSVPHNVFELFVSVRA